MRRRWIVVVSWAVTLAGVDSATAALLAGDVVVIGINSDSPDEFAWVPLVNLAEGEQLLFSDAGWIAGNFSGASGATQDGAIRFVVPTGGITAGTIMKVPLGTLPAGYADASDALVGPLMDLRPTGDQLVVFGGSTASPAFLFALNVSATQWGSAGSTSANIRTDLYPGLADGMSAVAVAAGPLAGDEYDNARYVGITQGTRDQLLAAVADAANWEGTDVSGSGDRFADLANGSAQWNVVSPASSVVPEPSSSAVWLVILAACLLSRPWRRQPPCGRRGLAGARQR